MNDVKQILAQRANQYQRALQSEGFPAKEPVWDAGTNTWDVWVKFEGVNIVLVLDVDDADFVRFIAPNFWELTPEECGEALLAADAE